MSKRATAESDPSELVPDGFDLDAMRRQKTTTPRDQLRECLYCGSCRVRKKVDKGIGMREQSEPYQCDSCGRHLSREEVEF